jgi:hypothetical protein
MSNLLGEIIGGARYHTIQVDGVSLAARNTLNVLGAIGSDVNGKTQLDFTRKVRPHDLTHNPIGLWQFNETLNDTSGNGFHFALNAGNLRYTEIAPGLRALSVSTANKFNFATLGTALQRTGDITIEMLLLLYGYPAGLAPIITYQASGETQATNTLYEVAINIDQLRWFSESGAGVDATFSIDRLPPLGTVCHLAVRRQANIIQAFINGAPLGGSSALTAPDGGTSASLWIGAPGSFPPAMAMASMKIVPLGLSETQIAAESNRTVGPALGVV